VWVAEEERKEKGQKYFPFKGGFHPLRQFLETHCRINCDTRPSSGKYYLIEIAALHEIHVNIQDAA
jgi:hypothetical protein